MASNEMTGWTGWVGFASVFMILAGLFQAFFGLVALFNNSVLVYGVNNIWLINVTNWGWAHLIFGVLIALVGYALMYGATWARVVAVILVSLAALANFASIPLYPFWALILFVVDCVIIYAITAHGGEMKQVS